MSVNERERAKALIDLVPDEDLATLVRMLRGLAARPHDPVLAALVNAPEDDEGELSEEAIAGVEAARRSLSEGRSLSTEELCRDLGL